MIFEDWGNIQYQEAYEKQKLLVSKIIERNEDERIIFCSHQPIVTLGKKSTATDLINWKGEVYSIERGGRATYHGPEQIIIYPILDLRKRDFNLGGHLRNLERVIIDLLKDYGIESRGNPDYAGVWVGDRKVASIGIAVKKWVTYHGLALNIGNDPLAFSGISACGANSNVMACLEDILGNKIERTILTTRLQQLLSEYFAPAISST
jgi:lipoyl(octanoyl) transferase